MKVLVITGGNIDDDFAFSFLKKNKYEPTVYPYITVFRDKRSVPESQNL